MRPSETDLIFTDTGQVLTVHAVGTCAGTYCPVHNPSEHAMRRWPLHLSRLGFPMMWRVCPCEVQHPDPDSLAYCEERWPLRAFRFHLCCELNCCETEEDPDGEAQPQEPGDA